MRSKKLIVTASITFAALFVVSIAFAALSSSLNISFGNVTQNALTWNVGFRGDSSTPTQEGSSNTGLSCGDATVTNNAVTISEATLSKPGDKCTYPLTIENKGDIAANLSSIVATEPTSISCTKTNASTMVCGNITYKLQTLSGTALSTGVTLNKKELYNIELVVAYTGENLNSTQIKQTNAKFTITYTQAGNRTTEAPEGVEEESPVCRRATTLHTETCTIVDDSGRPSCYATGYYAGGSKNTTTITYGSLGESGTLVAGDAFDCDVNGDGTYDAATERFYYVSPVDANNSSAYATLIYYTNVSDGVPNKTVGYTYSSTTDNSKGPTVAYEQLPSTSQWPNTSLSTQKRQLYTDTFSTSTADGDLPVFEYTNKAARMLSSKELNAACGVTFGTYTTGELDSCEYFLENTHYNSDGPNNYVYWLETPTSDSGTAWVIDGGFRFSWDAGVNDYYFGVLGVRPVIEVPYSDIDY